MQVGGADLHQASHWHFFDFAKLAEIHLRDRRNSRTARRACGRGLLGLVHHALDVGLDVFLENPSFRAGALNISQFDAELACGHAHRRTRVHFGAGLAWPAYRWSRGRGSLGFRYALLVWRDCLLLRCRFLRLGFGFLGWGRACDFQSQDQIAGLGFVTDLDRQRFHNACLGRRNFHAGLVGF